jgi:hypothetical protein
MPTPPRTSGFSCSRTCTAETRPAHPRSLLQDHRAWSHLLRVVPVLLPHHWPSTCSRVACCPARAHACGIEPSRPPAERSRMHLRMRQPNSARTSGSCNFAALSTCCDAIRAGLPPPLVFRCASNPRYVTSALTALPLRSCSFRACCAILVLSASARTEAHPRQTISARSLAAPWAGLPRAAAPQLHPRTPEPCASLARVARALQLLVCTGGRRRLSGGGAPQALAQELGAGPPPRHIYPCVQARRTRRLAPRRRSRARSNAASFRAPTLLRCYQPLARLTRPPPASRCCSTHALQSCMLRASRAAPRACARASRASTCSPSACAA